MEEKVLYNVLSNVRRSQQINGSTPDGEYLKSLITLGFITDNWDKYHLTSLGEMMWQKLDSKFSTW